MSLDGKYRKPIPPIFMFGFERSGTTLLSMMVGSHPEIAVPLSVTGLWYRYAGQLNAYQQLADFKDLEHLVDDLLTEERIRLWDVRFNREEVLDGLKPGNFAAVIERFHSLYARYKGKLFWGNLDIATLDNMDETNRWFPEARFLHIVRDGRDVALSHETMPYGASNTLEAAEKWVHRLRVNLKMGAMLSAERYMIIRYEDLILESETTLQRICQFIGVVYSPAMLNYPRMVTEKIPEDRRWLWPALEKLPVKSKAYGWKYKMSASKRMVFEGVANNLLKELDYEAYDRVPKLLSGYAFELWCFLGRGGRFKRLTTKLGIKRKSKLERSWHKAQQTDSGNEYSTAQQTSFGALVRNGVYDADFEHAQPAKAFFRDCMRYIYEQLGSATSLSILDCGCGPGAWLDFVRQITDGEGISPISYYGFDVTSEMVEVVRRRLSPWIATEHLQQGDILKDESYTFQQNDQHYSIIYAYDVIQQLPPKLQFDACKVMLRHLAPGGFVLIFDHDNQSLYGRIMGFKKFITRHLKIELVPPYYCNARYPALAKFADRIRALGQFATEIKVAPDGKKRALIIHAFAKPMR